MLFSMLFLQTFFMAQVVHLAYPYYELKNAPHSHPLL